jgi:acetyltransferase-like isoleucine patch superfamily enzyme
MMRFADRAFSMVATRRMRVSCGHGSRLKWWGLRGNRGGNVEIGNHSMIGCRMMFDSPDGRISVGDRTYIGSSLLVCHTGISIGSDVLISWGVTIVDHDSHSLDWRVRSADVGDWMQGKKSWAGVVVREVLIGNRVWIGFGAIILKGVSVGEGAIVGAGSVVTRSVEPYSVVAGNPARLIRKLQPDSPMP